MSNCFAVDTDYMANQPVSSALTVDGGMSAADFGGTDLYLDTTINGAESGLVHFGYLDGELWASSKVLRELGFVVPAGTPDLVRLNRWHGVEIRFDASRQSVRIEAPLRMLKLSTTVLNAPVNRRPAATASPGILLNYDLYGTGGKFGGSLSAFSELRAFGESGVFSSTALLRGAHGEGVSWQDHSVRLDTSWSTSFPDSLMTLRVGDAITGAVSWSRATRIAGVQLGTNFALQPYLVTAPLPAFLGSATLPSSVQLYVNGVQQFSGKVPAGPFQLNTIPSINGAGNAQVVLTDTLGRATTLNFPLYDEYRLLREGLSDWSAELGVVRENYGLSSFSYGRDPVGSGIWRYGVSNRLTLEAHAEATSGLVAGGAGAALLLGNAGGVVSAAVAQSTHAGRRGALYALGYSWRNDRFSFSAQGMHTRGEYSDVATPYGPPPPSVSAQATAGYSTGFMGSFGLSYLQLRYPQQDATRYASAYWSASLGRSTSLNIGINRDLANAANRSIFLVATMALDQNRTVSGSLQREGSRVGFVANASQSPPSEGGISWRAAARMGNDQDGGQGEVAYLGRYGQVSAGINAVGDTRYGYAGASGALVLMGGDIFAARRISSAFAVVSTDGIPNVPVRLENNPIGATNSKGLLLVTPLNAYQNNQLSIDPMDLPANVRIDRVKGLTTPTDRAGTLVNFSIKSARAALVTLQDADGEPLPVGSQVEVAGATDAGAIVGFDGVAYLQALNARNTLIVRTPAGVCRATFDYRGEGNAIPAIGPLRCRKDAAS